MPDPAASGIAAIPTLEQMQQWTRSLGQAQQILMEHAAGVLKDAPHASAAGYSAPSFPALFNADLLSNLSAYNLKTSPRSPMIGRGLNLQTVFAINPGARDFYGNLLPQGTSYDVGANEAVSA